MTVIVPSIINTFVNVLIFGHVRSSSRRIRPQAVLSVTNVINTQEPRISRREISLLRQMIFMFSMFVGGWTPVYLTVLIFYFIPFNLMAFQLTTLFAELCVLCITMNLFVCNHELREYSRNKIRQLF
jgi:hypothetical protein